MLARVIAVGVIIFAIAVFWPDSKQPAGEAHKDAATSSGSDDGSTSSAPAASKTAGLPQDDMAALIAQANESLRFVAQRTHSSVQDLLELQVAFEQIGISAEETQATLEEFAQIRRTTPGFQVMYGNLATNDALALVQVLNGISAQDVNPMTHAYAAQRAQDAGISETMLLQYEDNHAEFVQTLTKMEALYKAELDREKAGSTDAEAKPHAAPIVDGPAYLASKSAAGESAAEAELAKDQANSVEKPGMAGQPHDDGNGIPVDPDTVPSADPSKSAAPKQP